MLFNTLEFACFFVVVFALYGRLKARGQNYLLLGASYIFYGWWSWPFLGLLLISTIVDYTVGRRLGVTEDPRARRWLLGLSVATNLGILGFFKYFNFFVDSAITALNTIGLEAHPVVLQIVLPVGISFYTFQTMAYTIDVYRRRLEPCRDPLVFGLYVCFFPQLVAGPIERAQNLLPQFEHPRALKLEQIQSGALLFLIGLVRKVAIADVVAPEVNRIFADYAALGSGELTLGVLLFALQIYGDFAGYSDMARGLSRMLGVELMENFNHPYFSTNITVFWRRWHISLSSWLRDYLYIFTLGGNRGSKWFVYRNLMLTMLLGGLWHGAGWNFVIWGGLHGGALAVHKLWMGSRKPADRAPLGSPREIAAALWGWALTMILVALAWVFFRAETFPQALGILEGIFKLEGLPPMSGLRLAVMATIGLAFIDLPQYLQRDHTAMGRWHYALRGLIYAAMILAILLPRRVDVPFIYFQF